MNTTGVQLETAKINATFRKEHGDALVVEKLPKSHEVLKRASWLFSFSILSLFFLRDASAACESLLNTPLQMMVIIPFGDESESVTVIRSPSEDEKNEDQQQERKERYPYPEPQVQIRLPDPTPVQEVPFPVIDPSIPLPPAPPKPYLN
jgi:hypothetical protein